MAARKFLLAAPLVTVQAHSMHMNFTLCPEEEAKCYMHDVNADRALDVDADPVLHVGRSSFLQDNMLRGSGILTLAGDVRVDCGNLGSPPDVTRKFDEIFAPSGNRNAASHLWAHYILSRAGSCYSHSEIESLFGQFCAVSGSPLQGGGTVVKYELKKVGGGKATGVARHCCWPCACDTTDLLRVDTKTITDKAGNTKQYQFLVIGDPCVKNPPVCKSKNEQGCLPLEAPAVTCKNKRLKDAERSDNGHVIFGMFFTSLSGQPDLDYSSVKPVDDSGNTLAEVCDERAKQGYDSGMGSIFQMVGRLNPLS